MARRTPAQYDEKSIQRLKGLEAIRKKPGMYLGERGDAMVFQSLKEIADNALDEFFANRNKSVFVYADNKTHTYIVADEAQGIPVGLTVEDPSNPRSKKVSTLTLIFTEIHTGGKFDDKAYKTARGTHGVGAAATNAVSTSFEVWTNRDRKWHYQAFKCGKPVAPLTVVKFPPTVRKCLPKAPTCGTVVRFTPDQSIVSKDGGKTVAKLDLGFTARWLKDLAMLNPGVSITFSANGKSKTYFNKDGLGALIKERLAALELTALGKPFLHSSETLSVALQWSDYSDDSGVSTYVSSGATRDGGEHEAGLRNALVKAIAPFRKKTDKFAPKDLYYGLIGVLDFKMSQAEFSGQTKDRLTSNVAPEVERQLLPALTAFFNKNKSLARAVVRRANDVKKSKDEFKKTLDAVASAKKKSKSSLPGVLVSSPKATAANRELFLVEGDSASGTAKRARDSKFQEVMRLDGKPANAARMKLAKLLESKAVQNILTAIGYNFDSHRREDVAADNKIRINKLLLLPDADVDGPLAGNTPVLLSGGTSKTIKQLADRWKEDPTPFLVYSKTPEHKVVQAYAVAPRETCRVTTTYKIKFSNGSVFECTAEHGWVSYTNDSRAAFVDGISFVRAKDLRIRDRVIFFDRSLNCLSNVQVVKLSVVHHAKPVPMYCLSVPSTGNFMVDDGFGNGIGSSNCHIAVLILTLIYKLMPSLFTEGRVYLVDAPLFSAYYKGKRYFGETHPAVAKQLPKAAPRNIIMRAKGWGEIGHETLAHVAFHPDTRSVIKVMPVKGKEAAYFERIVGNDSTARKELLGL